jgi:hypothetical protein
MASRKYPLEQVRKLRDDASERAAQRLSAAIQKRHRAGELVRAAEHARDDELAAADAVRQVESTALANGELTAADVARAHAWEARIALERASADERVADAKTQAARAADAEAHARAELTVREVEANVIENHRARWDAQNARAVEALEEEASADAWRGKRE